jgi:hypothetical protein
MMGTRPLPAQVWNIKYDEDDEDEDGGGSGSANEYEEKAARIFAFVGSNQH